MRCIRGDEWTLLEGLARTRGYDLVVDGERFLLFPRLKMSGNGSSVFSQSLSEEGIEAASRWLQSKPRQFDPWPLR